MHIIMILLHIMAVIFFLPALFITIPFHFLLLKKIIITDDCYEWKDLLLDYGYSLFKISKIIPKEKNDEILSSSILSSFNIDTNINAILKAK